MTVAPDSIVKGKRKADLVEVPTRRALVISGAGDPDGPDFAAAIGALYGVA